MLEEPPRIHRSAVLAATAAAIQTALVACADGSDGTTQQAVVSDSAGIRLVSSPAGDRRLDWTFTPILTLGGEDEGPEAFFAVSERTVGVDSAGRIYLLDAEGHRLLVFADDGSHLGTFGREGEGPGEIAWPIRLEVKPDGTALIEDIGRGRVHGFDPAGMPVETAEELVPNNRRIWGDDGFYSSISTLEEDQMSYRFLRVAGSDTTELARLTVPTSGVIELESCGMALSGMAPLFSRNVVWDAWRDRAVVRVDASYQVEVFDRGRLVARYQRAVQPVEANRELAKRELGEGMRVMTPAGARECAWDEVMEKRGVADLVPAIRGVRVDPMGRIWISRGGPRPEPTPTDVLATDGTYLGTLPAETPFPIGFLPDGRVLAVETDALEVERLVVYRIEEGNRG